MVAARKPPAHRPIRDSNQGGDRFARGQNRARGHRKPDLPGRVEQRDQLQSRIQELQETLSRLNAKIEGYENGLAQVEEKLNK